MDKEILFTEQQRFKQWWLWLILISLNGLFLFGVFQQVVKGHPFGDKPMSDAGLLIVSGLFLLLTLLFIVFRLETQIKKDGIYVRFFPFHVNFKYFSWESLTKSFVRNYSAITEYGGWGLRIGLFGRGKAYNVSGNTGLQLEFKTSKRLLIGTGKETELTDVLTKLGQLHA